MEKSYFKMDKFKGFSKGYSAIVYSDKGDFLLEIWGDNHPYWPNEVGLFISWDDEKIIRVGPGREFVPKSEIYKSLQELLQDIKSKRIKRDFVKELKERGNSKYLYTE